MTTRRQTVAEDRLTVTRLKTSRDNSFPIPFDLIDEIFSRLPARTIARCRCVSKLWVSILGRQDFTELFLTRSSARPQLFFAYQKQGEFVCSSSPDSPQPQNPDENSSPVVAKYHMKFPFDGSCEIGGLVHGLVCIIIKRISKGRTETVPVICNPSTGQSLPLPKVETRRVQVTSFLGYDPIGKQFKVLSMTWPFYGREWVYEEHQILTLGTRKLSWRTIECCIPHDKPHKEICINGVLYYPATDRSSGVSLIVCFDVRSETFRSITVVKTVFRAVRDGTMINYNGKLGLVVSQSSWFPDGSIDLWVLKDVDKLEWSKHTYVFPALWQKLVTTTSYSRFVGVTRANEFVFSIERYVPSCLVYYNIERNTIRKVEIHGMEALKNVAVYIYPDHVQNVSLMQVV